MRRIKPLGLILILALFFSLTMVLSGLNIRGGLLLQGVNSADGVWNLALINELRHHFPPDHPGFAAIPLRAYHFLYHLLLALLSRVTFLPVIWLYFQILPVITAFLWGLGVYRLILVWFKNEKMALWSVFFSFFGGSFAFLLTLLFPAQKLSPDSAFGVAQPWASSLVNPAFASSIVLVIWSLYALWRYLEKGQKKWGLLLVLLSGLAIGFKAYAGMILLGAFLLTAGYRLIVERKKDLTIFFSLSLALSLLVFLPFNADYGFLTWAPLWPLHRLMQGTLNFSRWDELWAIYTDNHNYYGFLKLEIWALTLFFFGNLGTRLLVFPGLILLRVKVFQRKIASFLTFFLMSTLISFFIPFFFLQPTGGGFNIIQMYWYYLFFLAVLTGPATVILAHKIRRPFWRASFYLVVVILTVASSTSLIKNFFAPRSASVSTEQLALF